MSTQKRHNLHSTMLLLYLRNFSQPFCLFRRFTFHYASTLSRWWRGCTVRLLLIYIPLCFYFIGKGGTSMTGDMDLHSTMLLLYRRRGSYLCRHIRHLHSTMLLLYQTTTTLSVGTMIIYIPLCFYFISTAEYQISRLMQNLHSTMLLLYQVIGIDLGITTLHLHSTMLLLYQPSSLYVFRVRDEFTFHYASTLSVFRKNMLSIHLNLHSTMLLLYRRCGERMLRRKQIYIPLCFYFIFTDYFAC